MPFNSKYREESTGFTLVVWYGSRGGEIGVLVDDTFSTNKSSILINFFKVFCDVISVVLKLFFIAEST